MHQSTEHHVKSKTKDGKFFTLLFLCYLSPNGRGCFLVKQQIKVFSNDRDESCHEYRANNCTEMVSRNFFYCSFSHQKKITISA